MTMIMMHEPFINLASSSSLTCNTMLGKSSTFSSTQSSVPVCDASTCKQKWKVDIFHRLQEKITWSFVM